MFAHYLQLNNMKNHVLLSLYLLNEAFAKKVTIMKTSLEFEFTLKSHFFTKIQQDAGLTGDNCIPYKKSRRSP